MRMRLPINPLNSNLGPILHHFRDIAGFCTHDPALFHPIFGVFLLHQIAHVGVNVSRYLKLYGCEITFEFRSIPTSVKNIPQHHRRTDRRHTVA